MIHRTAVIGALAPLALAAPLAAAAADEARMEVGYLECSLLDRSGNIIKSTENFTCIFEPTDETVEDEVYVAEVTNWGVNLSSVQQKKIRWAVLSSADKYENGVLKGEYGGVSADVAAGAGVGVNALLGGSRDAFALQPVSLTTQQGIGVAAGIKRMKLDFVGDKLE